jgi:hypothetical protein
VSLILLIDNNVEEGIWKLDKRFDVSAAAMIMIKEPGLLGGGVKKGLDGGLDEPASPLP